MKRSNSKIISPRANGFTLIEATVMVFVSLALASFSLALLNQNITFYSKMKTQDFLTKEAPLISSIMSKLISQSDRYLLHNDFTDYTLGASQVSSNARSLALISISNGQANVSGIIVMNNVSNALEYYDGQTNELKWTITRSPADTTFSITEGILQMTLTGQNNEQIIYSGSFKL